MEIRRAESIEEYQRIESIQREIWGMAGESPVPVTILVAINNNGGLVEVAREDDQIIGFSLGFPGSEGDCRFLYSHMAGIIAEYRNRDAGYQIKTHQFEAARKMGYNEVRWTFDPMKARNCYFNVHKLKAFAYDFKINYYGHMDSDENRGVDSDRIEAHKFLDRSPIIRKDYTIVGKITNYPSQWEKIEDGGDCIALEIPSEIDNSDLTLARKWRLALRNGIVKMGKGNFVMTDVVRDDRTVLLVFTLKEKSGILKG